jgi:hypothetical protein
VGLRTVLARARTHRSRLDDIGVEVDGEPLSVADDTRPSRSAAAKMPKAVPNSVVGNVRAALHLSRSPVPSFSSSAQLSPALDFDDAPSWGLGGWAAVQDLELTLHPSGCTDCAGVRARVEGGRCGRTGARQARDTDSHRADGQAQAHLRPCVCVCLSSLGADSS